MRPEVCVDASVVVKWFIFEEFRDEALALLNECDALGIPTIAPDHVFTEVTSAFRVQVHRGVVSLESATEAVSKLMRAQIVRFDTVDLVQDAWRIAAAFRMATMYDAYYLALSELRGCDYWTADERLINSVPGLPYVRHIRDFVPGMLET